MLIDVWRIGISLGTNEKITGMYLPIRRIIIQYKKWKQNLYTTLCFTSGTLTVSTQNIFKNTMQNSVKFIVR